MSENKTPTIFQAIMSMLLFYTIQSFIVGVIVSIMWFLFLEPLFGLKINFIQWFGIVLCFNLIRFDATRYIPRPPNMDDNEIQ